MTPDEAIYLVEQCGLNIEGIKNIECESLIISALEKQIPKKGIKFGNLDFRNQCPVCSNITLRTKYCEDCGQALDWRDSE